MLNRAPCLPRETAEDLERVPQASEGVGAPMGALSAWVIRNFKLLWSSVSDGRADMAPPSTSSGMEAPPGQEPCPLHHLGSSNPP